MQIGIALSGTAASESRAVNWISVALSMILSLILVATMAPSANAEGHEGDATLNAESSCGEGGGEIGFSVTNNEAELDLDLVSADIYFGIEESVSYPSEGDIETGIPSGETSDTYFFTGLEDGDYYLEVYVVWDYGEGYLEAVLSAEVTVTCEGEVIDCGEGGCDSFEDPNGEWTATCEGCTGQVIIKDPGDNVAEIVVTGKSPFKLTLTTTGPGPNPGKASVDIDNDLDGEFESTLPKCGKNGSGDTNCVHIKRAGGHTQYTVFYNDDPGFSFK